MIHFISGILAENKPGLAVVEVNGVGFGIIVSSRTSERLGPAGKPVRLVTYLHVREDALQLFGFWDETEREMFLLLLTVSGIGPKVAMNILSGIAVGELAQRIRQGDTLFLKRLPGVGQKTAERMVTELRKKAETLDVSSLESVRPLSGPFEEALAALQSLGYKPADAQRALSTLTTSHAEASAENLIKAALQKLH